jgi:hypothetical protein
MKSKAKSSSAKKQAAGQKAVSALSVRQPFAELILRGIKKIEYRSIRTCKREQVYIYASKKILVDDSSSWAKLKLEPGALPTGVLIGTVEIVGCVGEPGDYRWKLARPKRLKKPIKPTRMPQPVFFWPF